MARTRPTAHVTVVRHDSQKVTLWTHSSTRPKIQRLEDPEYPISDQNHDRNPYPDQRQSGLARCQDRRVENAPQDLIGDNPACRRIKPEHRPVLHLVRPLHEQQSDRTDHQQHKAN